MITRTIAIDVEKCNGCGLCIRACHEGAIGLIDGKAALVRPNLCDGIGDCLPACPQDAIEFVEKEAVRPQNLMANPGYQWPIQLGLVSPLMECFKGELVIAADCTAFTYAGDFKGTFIKGKAAVIGCPKLDNRSHFDKISEILKNNDITKIDVIRIDIPCCNMLVNIVRNCIVESGKDIELHETIIGRNGRVHT